MALCFETNSLRAYNIIIAYIKLSSTLPEPVSLVSNSLAAERSTYYIYSVALASREDAVLSIVSADLASIAGNLPVIGPFFLRVVLTRAKTVAIAFSTGSPSTSLSLC